MTPHSTKQFLQNPSWKTLDIYTGDDLIAAYLKGKKEQRDQTKREFMEKFKKNIEKAKNASEHLLGTLEKKGFGIDSIHLKADTFSNFSILFVVDKNDFIKDQFREAFIEARKEKVGVEKEAFVINFNFTPSSDHLDEKCLNSEGFFLRYYGQR